MEQNCHRQYYINILVSTYLSFNWQERLAIDESGSWSMGKKSYRRILSIFKSRYLKYFKYLKSKRKFELSISKNVTTCFQIRSWIIYFHIFWVRTCFFPPIVCGNYPLNSKRGRFRSILSIDYRLNRIDPSTDIISPPNSERR